jgi:hypothetical protein
MVSGSWLSSPDGLGLQGDMNYCSTSSDGGGKLPK